jgi:CRISPR-associated protein Cas5d
MEQRSRRFRVRARGEIACFTRPEMKVERVSYEVMTPSAARGILEAVLWKPAMRWEIHQIAVLSKIAWTSIRRNEVNSRASDKRVEPYLADEDRAQRNTVALRDVDYVITATFVLTDRAGPDDNVRKLEAMFERRLEKGQHFHQPYLGCREMAAIVEPAPEEMQPIEPGVDRPLGRMLYDLEWPQGNTKPAVAFFFDARLEGGVVKVTSREQVVREAQEEKAP